MIYIKERLNVTDLWVCQPRLFSSVRANEPSMYACVDENVYMCMYACVHVCMYAWMCEGNSYFIMYVRKQVIYSCVCLCVCVRMNVRMHV